MLLSGVCIAPTCKVGASVRVCSLVLLAAVALTPRLLRYADVKLIQVKGHIARLVVMPQSPNAPSVASMRNDDNGDGDADSVRSGRSIRSVLSVASGASLRAPPVLFDLGGNW